MALIGHDTFLPVMDTFLAHWALVDAKLGAPGLVVLDGVGRAELQALRTSLAGKRTEVVHLENDVELAWSQLHEQKLALLERLGQFSDTLRAWWRGASLLTALPPTPVLTSAVDRVLQPVRQALWVWARANAGPAPGGVTLPLGLGEARDFTRAQFQTLADQFAQKRDAHESAEYALKVARAERDTLHRRIRNVLTAYGRGVAARLDATAPLVQTLPRLSPLPGHTPARLQPTADWDPEARATRLQWPPSADPKVARYQIRWCCGPRYRNATQRVALTLDAAEFTGTTHTPAGLPAPGDTASYKVFVILATGNERGSRPLTITRP